MTIANAASSNKSAPALKINPKKGALGSMATSRSDVFMIDPALIQIDPDFNARDFTAPENIAHVAALARSIASEGVQEPLKIVMRGNVPFVTNGESRLRAIQSLASRSDEDGGPVVIEAVPVRQESKFSNDADRLYTQVTSNSGKTFTPMETSNLFRRALNIGQTEEQIATRTGMDVRRVRQILDYQTLPSAVQGMIGKGTIKVSLAMETFIANGRDEEKTLSALTGAVENAAAAGKKVTKKYVGGSNGERKASPAKQMKQERAELSESFEGARFGEVDGDGEVEIAFTVTAKEAARIKSILGLK